jgi:hypothetical protein
MQHKTAGIYRRDHRFLWIQAIEQRVFYNIHIFTTTSITIDTRKASTYMSCLDLRDNFTLPIWTHTIVGVERSIHGSSNNHFAFQLPFDFSCEFLVREASRCDLYTRASAAFPSRIHLSDVPWRRRPPQPPHILRVMCGEDQHLGGDLHLGGGSPISKIFNEYIKATHELSKEHLYMFALSFVRTSHLRLSPSIEGASEHDENQCN